MSSSTPYTGICTPPANQCKLFKIDTEVCIAIIQTTGHHRMNQCFNCIFCNVPPDHPDLIQAVVGTTTCGVYLPV